MCLCHVRKVHARLGDPDVVRDHVVEAGEQVWSLEGDRWHHSSPAHFESILSLWLDLLEGSLGSWACLREYSQQKMIKAFHRRGTQSGSCRRFRMV